MSKRQRVPVALTMQELNICGTPYDVVYCESTKEVGTEEEPLYGTIIYDLQQLRIFKASRWEETFKTLLHEVFHGLRSQTGIAVEEDAKAEDDVCDVQANMLADFLIRNKWLRIVEVEK